MQYVYFVSYSHTHGFNKLEFGNARVFLQEKITSREHLENIKEFLEVIHPPRKNIVILNFQLLREEESMGR